MTTGSMMSFLGNRARASASSARWGSGDRRARDGFGQQVEQLLADVLFLQVAPHIDAKLQVGIAAATAATKSYIGAYLSRGEWRFRWVFAPNAYILDPISVGWVKPTDLL